MSCCDCKFFSEFNEPRIFDEYTIYGKCFKNAVTYAEKYPQGSNVYIPEGQCKSYKRSAKK